MQNIYPLPSNDNSIALQAKPAAAYEISYDQKSGTGLLYYSQCILQDYKNHILQNKVLTTKK